MFTQLNHGCVREIIGIRDVSTTKRNGYSEQEEIEHINAHTKFEILQRNGSIRIWIALSLSLYFEGEYWVSSDSKEKAYSLKMEKFYDTTILI